MQRTILAVGMALVLVLSVLLGRLGASAQASPPDFDLPNGTGHFYTQANGGAGPQYGYLITDEDGVNFWSEFRRLGGVDALGYPSSQRFILDGFTVQATQKVLMQWRPEIHQVYFVNVFDKLHDLGMDSVLQQTYQIPPQVGPDFDAGKTSFDAITAGRLALLNGDPAIAAHFYAGRPAPLAVLYNGLPTSQETDMGPFFAIRDQRDAFQRWKVDNVAAGIKAGDVSEVNGGDIAKQLGLVPAVAAYTETSAGVVNAPTPTATPTPAATATPTATPRPAFPYVSKDVNAPPVDCGPNNRVSCTESDPNQGTQFIQGHIVDRNGNGIGGVPMQAVSNYGLLIKTQTEGDGLFTFIIGTNCPPGPVVWTVTVTDSNGNPISDPHSITYTDCKVAGSFHFDFVKVG